MVATLRYLLDANVLSEPMRPRPDASVVEMLKRSLDECATSALVLHELEFGVARLPVSRKKAILTSYLVDVVGKIPSLPYDASAARWHALERARLAKRGRVPSFVDGQIAATAVVCGLVLITRNLADFQSFDGLRVNSWFSV
ncbi:MAG: type II toxin-antitoxin system VapC family toxin [Polyangiaceae bacterium]|nr:type II toxin-antitoxin system VapC family toxin [Polyangiaceae bacterium]